jgi:DNA-binding IclR family transcriptional regulator
MATQDTKSALKVLAVLDVLFRNFAHGFSSGELAKETGFSASDITRYVQTLKNAGFAELIPETQRIRPSVRHAQYAVQVQQSLGEASRRIDETRNRLFK